MKSPNDVKAWIAQGNGLMDTEQWPKAIDAYQKALKLDPKNVNVRVDLGTCYRNFGRTDKALKEYRTAIRIDPKHKNARRNAGVLLAYDLKRPKEAIIEFEKYLELAPDTPDAKQIRKAIDDLSSQVSHSSNDEL